MPSRGHLSRIHILKKEAALSEEDYQAMLSGFGVASSTEFNDRQAAEFAAHLQEYVDSGQPHQVGNGWGKNKYEHLRGRRGGFADPRQLRKIEAMWRDVARNTSDAALAAFIERQTGVKKITWLKKKHVNPILTALAAMKHSKK